MNSILPVLFLISSLNFAFSDDCSQKLFEGLKKGWNLTEKCGGGGGQCRILDSVINSEGTNWTGFCSGNRYFFFQNWQCREDIFEIVEVVLIVQATENSCTINRWADIRNLDGECLRKYNLEQCRRNSYSRVINCPNSTAAPSSERQSIDFFGFGGEENQKIDDENEISLAKFPSFWLSPATKIPFSANSSVGSIKKRSLAKATETAVSKYSQSESATESATAALIHITTSAQMKRLSGSTNYSLRNEPSSTEPCKPNEMFFNDYCYFLRIHKYLRRASQANLKEIKLANSTESCNYLNPDALGLAIETKKENRLVLNFLKELLRDIEMVKNGMWSSLAFNTSESTRKCLCGQLQIDSPILTSGIKEKGLPGQWQDWDLEVDEEVINCTSTSTPETMLYTIDPVTFTWRLFNISSIESFHEKNNEWYVMCKRPHYPRLIKNELYKRCLKLYRASQCYNPFKFIDYCCAVDERGELWFGCPNEICVKQDQDGSECAWNCNDDGLFVQEYPICRQKNACKGKWKGIAYSAPAGRHALGTCPNNLVGYSTWYCASNKTFVGTPNYVCCHTEKKCKTTDPYLNTWVGCPSKKAEKRIFCPSKSLLHEAIADWFCTKEGVFKGSYPNYSNCNKSIVVCLKKDKYDREWKAAAGSLAKKNCPDYTKEKCFWRCKKNGEFETSEPDCSKCRVKWMDKVSDKIKNGTHYKEVMEIIESHTRTEDLTIGFSHVLNLTSDSVDLFKRQSSGNETAFNEFLMDYSRILKNTAGKLEIWSTLLLSRRRMYADRIVKMTRNASFAYLTFRSGADYGERKGFNGSFADFETDGFDFFVQYGPSLSGVKFPPENHKKSDWRLEVEEVNGTGFEFAVMGLIMNHSLSFLMFPLGNETANLEMNSPAVTFSVASSSEMGRTVLVPDVHLSVTFKHVTKTRYPESKVIRRRLHDGEEPSGIMGSTLCYYYRNPDWSNEGCSVTHTSKESTSCSCKHLSTIGLLMSVHEYEPDDILETVSLISSSLTIVALALTVAVFFAFDTIKNERVLIGINLSVCLIAGHFLLITVMDKRFFYIPDSWCTIYAILLHYAFMAAFAWMFVEGFHLYRMLVLVFESNIEFRLIYVVIGYGMPVLIIGLTEFVGLAFEVQPYGQDELCWLKTPNYVWAFNGPVVVLTSMIRGFWADLKSQSVENRRDHIPFFTIIVIPKKPFIFDYDCASLSLDQRLVVISLMNEMSFLTHSHNGLTWIKGCISLSALLGITWLIGLAYIFYNQLFAYSFVILNGLQGFFIFLFRCVCNVQYKKAFFQKFKSCFLNADEFGNYKKLENFKSGSKLFAITQSGIKSLGSESVSTILNGPPDKQIREPGRNFFGRFFRFERFGQKAKVKNQLAEEESSSGIGLDFDGMMVLSSRGGTLRSRLSTENLKPQSEEEDFKRKKEGRIKWWREENDFPELSYHMNYYVG